MKTSHLPASLALMLASQLMLAQPVLAQPVNTIMILRDSDGIVISVLHPVDYYFPGVGTTGGIVYTMGGVPVEFSTGSVGMADNMAGGPVTIDMLERGPTAMVGTTVYKVEVSGNDVYLRDPATGALFATQRMAAVAGSNGLQVNPNGFAME